MNVQISKHFDFEAAHFLPKVPAGHKCGRMHGHSYRATLVFECEEGQLKDGMIVDYAEIVDAWRVVHERLDHSTLNEVEGLENPTTEVLAPWIYFVFAAEAQHPQYTKNLYRAFKRVIVQESRTTSCTYPA